MNILSKYNGKISLIIMIIFIFVVFSSNDSFTLVEANTSTTSINNDIFFADVTFYDYYGRYELNDIPDINNKSGQHYSFENFNQAISDYASSTNMEYPLYFGDFIGGAGGSNYPEKNPILGQPLNGNAFRFYWAINRANRNANYSASLQGIVSEKLDSQGYITQKSSGSFILTDENSKRYYYGEDNSIMIEAGNRWLKNEEIFGRTGTLQIWLKDQNNVDVCERIKINSKEKNYSETMKYLTFEIYNDGSGDSGSPYISLEDGNGSKIGGLAEGFSTEISDNKMPLKGVGWKRIIIDLDKLKGNSSFDFSNVANIYLGYWASGDIYINDIRFTKEIEEYVRLPYFDSEFIEGNNVGEVISDLEFPFMKRVKNECYYYSFSSSKNQFNDSKVDIVRISEDKSNLYYKFDIDNNNDNDIVWDMNGVSGWRLSGNTNNPGFFPFNSNSDSSKVDKLNYGFGTKIEIPFLLTNKGTVIDLQGNEVPIEFNFKGDDDVWVYVDNNLVLDMGGAHSQATGNINFYDSKATVDNVVDGDLKSNSLHQNVKPLTKEFKLSDDSYIDGKMENGYDTEKVHVITIFFMERGMIESNLYIDFNFIPVNNEVIVEKEVDVSNVNPILEDKIENIANNKDFTFNIYENDIKKVDEDYKLNSNSTVVDKLMDGEVFKIKNRETVIFEGKFSKDSEVKVEEIKDDRFTTSWIVKDLTAGKETILSGNEGQPIQDNITNKFFVNSTHVPYAYMKHYVKFINKIKTGVIKIGKEVNYADSEDETFKFKVSINKLLGDEITPINYYGEYELIHKDGSREIKNTKEVNGSHLIEIKEGQSIEIKGIPLDTEFEVEEIQDNSRYKIFQIIIGGNKYIPDENIVDINKVTGKIDEEIIYVNEKVVRNLLIRKVDSTNNSEVLKGAKFKIYKTEEDAKKGVNAVKNPDNISEDWELKTDKSGEVIFKDLPYGQYWIVETVAPDGYQLLKEAIEVNINSSTAEVIELTISNNKEIILPITGGSGITVIRLLGILVILSSLLIYKKIIKI